MIDPDGNVHLHNNGSEQKMGEITFRWHTVNKNHKKISNSKMAHIHVGWIFHLPKMMFFIPHVPYLHSRKCAMY